MGIEKVLIVGFGDIGRRLVHQLSPESYQVFGLCRHRKASVPGVTYIQADARECSKMETVCAEAFDVIIVTLTPGEASDQGYKSAYVDTMVSLVNTLEARVAAQQKGPRLVLFVSSTRVYGQCQGEGVDEASVAQASDFRGRRLLEAEHYLLNSQLPGCVVRFSGIYGRREPPLLQRVKEGGGGRRYPPLYTNRIHADDCAGVLAHLVNWQYQGNVLEKVYLATDCDSASTWDITCWMATQLGLPSDRLREPNEQQPSSGKRCSNRLLLSTGYQFKYPSYREGYLAFFSRL